MELGMQQKCTLRSFSRQTQRLELDWDGIGTLQQEALLLSTACDLAIPHTESVATQASPRFTKYAAVTDKASLQLAMLCIWEGT